MKIEDAIQQTSFQSEYQKVVINLSYTYFCFKDRFSSSIKPFGITIQQYNVLRILRGQFPNGITTSDIRSRMLDKMSDASRLVDRLEKNEFVEKCRNSADKRLVVVKISEKGLQLLKEIELKESEIYDWAVSLTESEAQQLNALLDKLRS